MLSKTPWDVFAERGAAPQAVTERKSETIPLSTPKPQPAKVHDADAPHSPEDITLVPSPDHHTKQEPSKMLQADVVPVSAVCGVHTTRHTLLKSASSSWSLRPSRRRPA